ncbi:WRKY transcription factor 55-like isoform X3 [Apium graveolens]|uniref:WRKY transcription factor 55-like isoform X3 n=1 Tax=Apium graveolens TaxID=4045 RepID=UPI003D7A71C4
MEEIVSLIYNGCRLARDLEVNLPNLANQPEILWNNCHEIVRIFTDTRDRINAQFGGGNQSENVGGAMQQWLQLVQQQEGGSEGAVMVPSETERWTAGGRGEQQLQPLDGAVSAARGATFQRMRRRKDDADKRSIRVPAPQMGNTEIPPEDGFTWRKYGQKEILGSRFPRVDSSSGTVAGPSTARDVGNQYYDEPLTEFVDVMFNSGSSSNSNMDLIFSTATEDQKWDSGENKQD